MTDLIEVEFVGGPWDGPGKVTSLASLYQPVAGHPEGYYTAAWSYPGVVIIDDKRVPRFIWVLK